MNANKFLKLPPVEWQKACDRMSTEQKRILGEELDALARHAAMAAGYVEARYGGGCGDQCHKDAVKRANRNLKAVRKALGYTYPDRGCFTF